MLKVGDTVKVIAPTEEAGSCGERKIEYIPIGTICTVIGVEDYGNGLQCCGLDPGDGTDFWYLSNEVEKGKLEWIPEK